MTQVVGTKTANVVFIYNAIEYCSEQTVETSKITLKNKLCPHRLFFDR